jgi:glycine/serine hydroxymethyltransferase
MKEKEVIKISKWISQIISKPQDENLLSNIRKEVSILCNNFPVYR